MNIFLAGVHGVGKTFLAQQMPDDLGFLHTSASKLIKEERSVATWGVDKKVSDIDANQLALGAAVKRHNNADVRLLLDGHFVLRDKKGDYVRLGVDVFKNLNLNAVILLEAEPGVIAERIHERDRRNESINEIEKFLEVERSQAQMVCGALGIGLTISMAPTVEEFAKLVRSVDK